MKISLTFRVFAFLMAVLIFSMPFVTLAQQNSIETEAKAQAIADAKNDANKTAWFMTGCFLNVIGVVIARTNMTPVPAGRFVGKSSRYIAAYTSIYQAKRVEIQVESALQGCILGCLGCLLGLLVAGSSSGGGGGGSWCSPFF